MFLHPFDPVPMGFTSLIVALKLAWLRMERHRVILGFGHGMWNVVIAVVRGKSFCDC